MVAGGGMLSPRSNLQVCVLNTHVVDKYEAITCTQDGEVLYSTYSFPQSCHLGLLMRRSMLLALLSKGEKLDLLSGHSVNDLYVCACIMGSDAGLWLTAGPF